MKVLERFKAFLDVHGERRSIYNLSIVYQGSITKTIISNYRELVIRATGTNKNANHNH